MNKEYENQIDLLLEQLNIRKFGCDNKARYKIIQYFDIVSIEKRHHIIKRLLNGNTLDRYAGYTCMEIEWDNSFIPYVEEIWSKVHEKRCARFICRYFPQEFINEHISELSLFFDLQPDKDLREIFLTTPSNSKDAPIAIVVRLKDKSDSKELREMLYATISEYIELCEDDKEFQRVYKIMKGQYYFTTRCIPGVSLILECMFYLGFLDALIEFHKFELTNQISLLEELRGHPIRTTPSKDEWIDCWKLFLSLVHIKLKNYYYQLHENNTDINETQLNLKEFSSDITNDIQQTIFQKMYEKNQNIKKLQDILNLELK